jgi:soluble lytic murein transglycosylase-like protein
VDVVRIASGVLVIALAMAPHSHAVDSERMAPCGTKQWQTLIAEAAERFGIPHAWLHAVMRAESAGCTHLNGQPVTSSAGAMGLMQLIPATWAQYRARLSLGDDPHAPKDNILAGTAYLRDLYDAYGYPGLFAAYHAGPGRYEQHLSGTRPLPRATIEYLARVQGEDAPATGTAIASAQNTEPANRSVFIAHSHASPPPPVMPEPSASRPLFVPLSPSRAQADVQRE